MIRQSTLRAPKIEGTRESLSGIGFHFKYTRTSGSWYISFLWEMIESSSDSFCVVLWETYLFGNTFQLEGDLCPHGFTKNIELPGKCIHAPSLRTSPSSVKVLALHHQHKLNIFAEKKIIIMNLNATVISVCIIIFVMHVSHASPQARNRTSEKIAYSPGSWKAGIPYEAHLVGLFTASSELPVFHEVIKPALDLAIEEAERRYPQIKFKISLRRGSNDCQRNYAGAYAAEEFYLRKVDAFIGPACSMALDAVGRMASYWNVPIFTAGGIGAEFSNKGLFSTLTRLSFSLGMYFFYLFLSHSDKESKYLWNLRSHSQYIISLQRTTFLRSKGNTVNHSHENMTNHSLFSFWCVFGYTDRVGHFIIQILSEFNWHHISLIVDETEFGNTLIRRSFETVFSSSDQILAGAKISYDIKLDIQSFTFRNYDGEIVANKTIDYRKILQTSSRSARGQYLKYVLYTPNNVSCRIVLLS